MAEEASQETEANQQTDDETVEGGTPAGAQTETDTKPGDDASAADKIVEKLQKRIGKEQSEKNDFKDKYEAAMKQLEALQKGEDPDKADEPDDSQKQINALQAQIARRDMRDQARTVITEAGFSVPTSLLDTLVVDDDKQTLANVKAIIEYTNQVQSAVREEFRKGKTPRSGGQAVKPVTKEAFDAMTPMQKLEIGVKDPTLYAKLLAKE